VKIRFSFSISILSALLARERLWDDRYSCKQLQSEKAGNRGTPQSNLGQKSKRFHAEKLVGFADSCRVTEEMAMASPPGAFDFQSGNRTGKGHADAGDPMFTR